VREHVRSMTEGHPDANPGGKGMIILNVGYGLGIVSLRLSKRATGENIAKGASRSTELAAR
jgi:hypothetical protein